MEVRRAEHDLRSLLAGSWRHFCDDAAEEIDEVEVRSNDRRRSGKKHQIGDHLVGAHGLHVDGRQHAAFFGIALQLKQRLGSGSDVREGIIDLVRSAIGQLLQGIELGLLKRPGKILPYGRRLSLNLFRRVAGSALRHRRVKKATSADGRKSPSMLV